jgi:hypothetical protein
LKKLNNLIRTHSNSKKNSEKHTESAKKVEFVKLKQLKIKCLDSMSSRWKKLRQEIKTGKKFKVLLEKIRVENEKQAKELEKSKLKI